MIPAGGGAPAGLAEVAIRRINRRSFERVGFQYLRGLLDPLVHQYRNNPLQANLGDRQ